MTDWRAVGIGFLVQFVVGLFGFLVPGIGHVVAGFLGGVAAGYVAHRGVGSGAWHGLLAGAIGGIVLTLLFAVVVTIVGSIATGPFGPFFGGATVLVGVIASFLFALDSAVGGALGGWIAGR